VVCPCLVWKRCVEGYTSHSPRCSGWNLYRACYDVTTLVSGGGSRSWPWVFCCCIFVSAVLHQVRDEITRATLRLPLVSCRLPSSALPLPRSAGSATCSCSRRADVSGNYCLLLLSSYTQLPPKGTGFDAGRLNCSSLSWKRLHLVLILQFSLLTLLPPVQRLATGWTIGIWGFDSQRELGIFLFTIRSRLALGPTQLPIQWVPGTLSPGIKRPRREAYHSPPSSAEVNNAWRYTSAPNTSSCRGA
jgi:hypothetical protein